MTESEWQTRKQRIDARLRSLSPPWQIIRDYEGIDLSALTRCSSRVCSSVSSRQEPHW